HYGDPKDWLCGDQWDTVMNYDAFMEPITWFLTGMEKHSEQSSADKYNNAGDFEAKMRYYMSRFSFESLASAMNELSNHDHSRFLTRTNKKVGRLHTMGAQEADTGINKDIMKEAITFQMTWIGAPTIYYGDEAGLTGWTDPDNRRTYPWGREDREILDYYKTLIKIHKRYRAFAFGSLDYLYMSYGIMCYGRWTEDEKIIVVLNNNDTSQEVIVPVWRVEAPNGTLFNRIIQSGEGSWDREDQLYTAENGCIKVMCKAQGSCVIVAKI
ncbi:MAG: alpha-amylase family glycosyl hydrolase, partial [Clostridia bacterium]|nr:alpha-amylase family glycosyl hydrolase [Clostridia bacterium]